MSNDPPDRLKTALAIKQREHPLSCLAAMALRTAIRRSIVPPSLSFRLTEWAQGVGRGAALRPGPIPVAARPGFFRKLLGLAAVLGVLGILAWSTSIFGTVPFYVWRDNQYLCLLTTGLFVHGLGTLHAFEWAALKSVCCRARMERETVHVHSHGIPFAFSIATHPRLEVELETNDGKRVHYSTLVVGRPLNVVEGWGDALLSEFQRLGRRMVP